MSLSNSCSSFQIEMILPFIALEGESSIQLGPILFSSASSSFFEREDRQLFQSYLQTIGFIQAPDQMTCLSIHSAFSSLPERIKKSLMMDALHLLYFAAYFRNLYVGEETPSFTPFRKMIPASLRFIKDKKNWAHLSVQAADQEETTFLHCADSEICGGLGKLLEVIYQTPSIDPLVQTYKRFVRAIRYLVDRLFHRLVNLFDKESLFSAGAFEAEEVVFLASSFEVLFDISDRQSADFKHKLRPLLHIKYGRPMEMFWKWVDDFYALKQAVMRGDVLSDSIFRLNPNFEISHLLLGTKLFVYSVYYTLFKYNLISSTHSDPGIPPDFKWIDSEEVLLFFWTEDQLLGKLNLFINQAREDPREELYADIHLLSHFYAFLYRRYQFGEQNIPGVRFILSSSDQLKQEGEAILEQLKQDQVEHTNGRIGEAIAPYFLEALEKRLVTETVLKPKKGT